MRTTVIYYSPILESIMLIEGESLLIETMLGLGKIQHVEPSWAIIGMFEEDI